MLSPRYWTFLVIVLAAIIYSVIRMSHATQPVSSPAAPAAGSDLPGRPNPIDGFHFDAFILQGGVFYARV